MLITAGLFIAAMIVVIIAFVASYNGMKHTTALERQEYLSELTNQVAAKVDTCIYRKFEEAAYYVELVNRLNPA